MNKKLEFIPTTNNSQPRTYSGFTLIEVLVSAAILVILGFGFLGLQYILSKNQTAAWNNYFAIEETNRAISNFTKEVRNAASSDNGGYPLESLGDQEIIFYSDYDYDGSVERIRYTLSGTQFIKGIIEPSGNPVVYDTSSEKQAPISEIIRNGVDPVFFYYNGDWPGDTVSNPLPLSDRISETRFVRVVLKSNPRPSSPNLDYIIESNTRIRSIGNN